MSLNNVNTVIRNVKVRNISILKALRNKRTKELIDVSYSNHGLLLTASTSKFKEIYRINNTNRTFEDVFEIIDYRPFRFKKENYKNIKDFIRLVRSEKTFGEKAKALQYYYLYQPSFKKSERINPILN